MNPSKIVITGTIASGKSTLSNLLKEYGFDLISADEINKKLLEKGEKNYLAIKNSGCFDQAFDREILDKKKLAEIIFSDSKKLSLLNKLTHKNILEEINREISQISKKVVFIEIPLYFQMKEKFAADEIWLVIANEHVQLQRLAKRDGIDLTFAKTKIESQKTTENMIDKSQVVFDNSSSVDELNKKLKEILEKKDLLWKF